MKIECTIRRKFGSSQRFGDQVYVWNDENGHVCEVENPEHAAVLLAVPSSWRIADGEPVAGEQPVVVKAGRRPRTPKA